MASVKERECGAWLCKACCASYVILWSERKCADCDLFLHCQECLNPIALDRLVARAEWTELTMDTEFILTLCPQCEAMCAGVDMASYRPIAYSQISYAE